MVRWSLAGLSLLLLLGATPQASGNGGIPPFGRPFGPVLKPGPQEAKLVVQIDDKVKQPRLEIPRSLLLVPGPGGLPGPGALPPGPPIPRRFGALSVPTTVAALAIALTF